MATNLKDSDLYVDTGENLAKIDTSLYNTQLTNTQGIPVLMADSIAVDYTTEVKEDAYGIDRTVANFTTLDEKLEALENSITA